MARRISSTSSTVGATQTTTIIVSGVRYTLRPTAAGVDVLGRGGMWMATAADEPTARRWLEFNAPDYDFDGYVVGLSEAIMADQLESEFEERRMLYGITPTRYDAIESAEQW